MAAKARAKTLRPVVHQSAVIPYRLRRRGIEIAIITATRSDRWLVPKGHLEPGLTPQASAAKEAYEEAGLLGRADSFIVGRFEYIKRRQRRLVHVYPMAVLQELERWPERRLRERRWVSMDEAAELVCYKELGRCIRAMHELLLTSVAA